MDAKQFLAEFGHIANAPAGVARLRELVLQLAISGRLVERISTDSPVDDSLDQAAMQRAAYESELELRPTRLHSPLNTSPFAIPAYWRWVRLEQLALYIQRGKGPKYAESGAVSVVSQKCIQWAGFDISQARKIADESVNAYGKERFLCPGDLLWNSTGTGTAGRVAIFDGRPEKRAVTDSHVTVMRLANSQPKYLWCVIASPWVQARILPTHPESLVSGTTQQVELATSTARALAVPCPPVEEQVRIVAKVNELMALCDQLEKQQQERRQLQNALRKSTLQVLASAESPRELQESWQRLEAHFESLFSDSSDTNSLKSLLLKLAMRGLLVKQEAGDLHSETFLQQIANEKARLIAAKTLKASAAIPAPSDAELPYVLPAGWTWARVVDLVDVGTGATPAKSEPTYYGGETPWYTSSATNEKFARKPETFITEKALAETNCKVFPAGSLIVAMYGQGKTRGQVSELVVAGATNQAIAALVFFESSKPTKRFLKYFFEKIYDEIRLQAEGGPQPNLSVGKIKEILVPVPPLEERERIVARLDELFEQCDEWSSLLKRRDVLARQFAALAVAKITGVANERSEDVAVKVPQTELIAPLRLGTLPDIKDQAPLATLLARHQGEMSARDLSQRFGGEIGAFYAQLKTEVAHGWIEDPSYELGPNAPEGPRTYPDGVLVAKMKIKQEA